jgi:hypothetical protein
MSHEGEGVRKETKKCDVLFERPIEKDPLKVALLISVSDAFACNDRQYFNEQGQGPLI